MAESSEGRDSLSAGSLETTLDLIDRARTGDPAAIEQLFARHLRRADEMADVEPQRLGNVLASPELDPYRQEERFKNLKRRLRLEPQ